MEIISESKAIKYGGFWRRFIAFIIDCIVLFFIQAILNLIIYGNLFYSPTDINYEGGNFMEYYSSVDWGAYFLYLLIDLATGILYFAGMQSSSKQATIGKMTLDMKVVTAEGERITFLRGVGRYLSKIVSAITFLIGYIIAAFDSKKRALHDMMANTLVIVEQ